MKIIVDADACPVVDHTIAVAKLYEIKVLLVKSYSHFSLVEYPDHVEVSYVDPGHDAADYKIVGLSSANDIIVTQDYGLAALALERGCQVIHHVGFIYSKDKIDQMLEDRHFSAQARKAGLRTKGPKKLKAEQKEHFAKNLRKLCEASKQD